MNQQPCVSIILPSLNVASFIRECLDSVLNQTLKNIEIICVDAGSTDGTLEILHEYEAKDKRIKILISDMKSYGRQINIGIDAATGEYIGIVETDDWVLPTMYKDLYEIAKKNDVEFAKADFYRFTQNSDGSLDKRYEHLTNNKSYYGRVLNPGEEKETFKFVMNTWSGIYSLEFLRHWDIRHNETPGSSFQDNGFWFQTFCRAERALFIDKPYYMNRRDNPNSSVFNTSKVYCMRDEYDYIQNIINNDLEKLSQYIPLCNYFRFCGYYYNTYKRIAKDLRREFLEQFSNEFKVIANNNGLDRSLFSNKEWNDLQQIMYYPDQFFAIDLSTNNRPSVCECRYKYMSTNAHEYDNIKISIIIAVFNTEKYLKSCLDSIFSQTFTDYEIICVDDGSTDNSPSILDEYAAKDSRMLVFHKENEGPSIARNWALAHAHGEYICFIDSDDMISKKALNILYNTALTNHSDIVVYGFNIIYSGNNKKVLEWLNNKTPIHNINYPEFTPFVLFDEPGGEPFTWRNFIRRKYLADNNIWFWENCYLGEDLTFQFEAFPKAKNITFITDKLYFYRYGRSESLMGEANINHLVKAEAHIDVVLHAYQIWECYGLIDSYKYRFVEWAIDYIYNEFINMLDDDKPIIAKKFYSILNYMFTKTQQSRLGPGRKQKLADIALYLPSDKQLSISNCVEKYYPSFHDKCYEPLFTFIVPVLNMQDTIYHTIGSLLQQTITNIEVICINDASTDNTAEILKSIADIDHRLTIITYPETRTANQARKDGVLLAEGKYILFCDGDDTYRRDACEIIYQEMQKNPVDILHFGTNIISHNAAEEDIQWVDSNNHPFDGYLFGSNVFEGCFRGKVFAWNLWNKAYEVNLAKKAFSHVEDGRFPRGQDVYAFALLSYYAQSYRGISKAQLYNYNMGLGMDGNKQLSLKEFSSFCSLSKVVEVLYKFFCDENILDKYEDIWIDLRAHLFGDCVNKWYKKIAENDKGAALDLMLNAWPHWLVVDGIARRYWESPKSLFPQLKDSQTFSLKANKQKTIGMYYHARIGGGAENVMNYLADIFIELGYRIVILRDIQSEDSYIEERNNVKHYAIPNNGVDNPEMYIYRARRMIDIIVNEHIDIFIDHAWNTSLLPWDMLAIKSVYCPVLIQCHSIFSLRLLRGESYFAELPYIYSYSDGIICLSDADKEFWSKFNSNTYAVMNPIAFDIPHCKPASLQGNTILWAGRLSPEKRPADALYIFSNVHDVLPNTKLCICGSTTDSAYEEWLIKIAVDLNIADSVEFLGYQDNMQMYYQNSDVFLMTSEYEGFGLVLLEAQAFGLPIVMYELPYVQIVRESMGIQQVPQGNIEQAAEVIIKLLQNPTELKKYGSYSRAYAMKYAKYPYKQEWGEILKSLNGERQPVGMSNDERIMWDTLLRHYSIGSNKLQARIHSNHNYYNGTQDEAALIRSSVSFKVGRFLTWPARKIRTFIRCIKEHGWDYTMHVYFCRNIDDENS